MFIYFYHNQQPLMKTFHDFPVDMPSIMNIELQNKSTVKRYATFMKNRNGHIQVTTSTREAWHNSKNNLMEQNLKGGSQKTKRLLARSIKHI